MCIEMCLSNSVRVDINNNHIDIQHSDRMKRLGRFKQNPVPVWDGVPIQFWVAHNIDYAEIKRLREKTGSENS